MELGNLPDEILEKIFSELDLEDVLNSNLVSIEWRNLLNNNRIWNKFCQGISNKINLPSKSRVKPFFKIPEIDLERLDPICDLRVRFMQEIHLRKNLRNGNYVCDFIDMQHGCNVECDGESLIMPELIKRSFRVWDIRNRPLEKKTVLFALNHVMADFFKFSNDILIVVQCTLVQMYRKNDEANFILDKKFILNDSRIVVPDRNISNWYRKEINIYPIDISLHCDHNGTFLIGTVQKNETNYNNNVLHIWDLKKTEKIKEEKFPSSETISDIQLSMKKNLVYIMLRLISQKTKICSYDLKQLKYTNFILNFDYYIPLMIYCDNLIINCDHKKEFNHIIYFWNNINGNILCKLPCRGLSQIPSTFLYENKLFVYAETDMLISNVKVFDTEKMSLMTSFEVDYVVTSFSFLSKDMLFISPLNLNGMELWQLSPPSKLMNYKFSFCLYSHPFHTKVVVENYDSNLGVLHFW